MPVGNRLAREELEKPHPDLSTVRRAFIQARNHPDDIDGMARLFRNFRSIGEMKKAVAIWKRGDIEIDALVAAGERLNSAVEGGVPASGVAPILAAIDAVNARVTPLEDDFSFTLGQAGRWVRTIVVTAVAVAAALLFSLSSFVVRRLVHEIAASERRYRTVTETAMDGILSVDERGRIPFANSAAARIFGYPVDRLIGANLDELLPEGSRAESRALLTGTTAVGAHGDSTAGIRLKARHQDGREIPLEVSFGESGDGRGVFTGIFRDISLRAEAERQIEKLAHHDALTGLPNRALFQDRLSQALSRARRDSHGLAVLFLDLDEFKLINDSLGHTRGDEVLREVGRRLKACLRGGDTAARVGGDEFLVLLPQVKEAAAVARVAEKILEAIARPIEIQGQSLFVKASIGISQYPDDAQDADALMRNADIAMYRAKEHGSDTSEFFTAEMNRQRLLRHDIEQDLYKAVDRGELVLHYQAIWSMSDERIVGVEALLRWNHPSRGQMLPGDFIPVAESSPVMLPVGNWVLANACDQLRRWRERGLPLDRVCVNVAARQLQQKGLAERQTERSSPAASLPTP